MAATASGPAPITVSFDTHPSRYRHWKLSFDGPVATLGMDVQEDAGLSPDYRLKLNSYDLGVDIELADAIERIRFEHPEVHAVVITSLKERIFCAGANIFMLRGSSHAWKVNFCKFTNETRLAMEDASAHSGLKFLAALKGSAHGGTNWRSWTRSCSDVAIGREFSNAVLAVRGLVTHARAASRRRDLADFSGRSLSGVKGKRAVEWRLVTPSRPRAASRKPSRSARGAGREVRPAIHGPGITQPTERDHHG
jgi:benzoyl-CoA-dihydrodiol lyase